MDQKLCISIEKERSLGDSNQVRILLFGIKHSGKSSLAQRCAQRFGWILADTDNVIQEGLPGTMTVRKYYSQYGPEAFRKLEYTSFYDIISGHPDDHLVIAMGGGACDNPDLMALAGRTGIGVFLDIPEEVLYRRIIAGGIPPFLSPDDPEGSFHTLWKRRRNLYLSSCDVRISGGDESIEHWADLLTTHLPGIIERYYGRKQFW